MVDSRPQPVSIIGAGLSGCLLATLIGRAGTPVTVYERRPDPRHSDPERGRSINLTIAGRGLAALQRAGLDEVALAQSLPLRGRMVHDRRGAASFQSYSADGRRAINSISRVGLNRCLLDAADRIDGVTFRFSHRLVHLDAGGGCLSFETPGGTTTERAKVVFGTDGAYSATRRALQFQEGFNYSQEYLEHGYKELTIAPRHGDFALDPAALHIWPRGSTMMVALPNQDRSFTCTLFLPKAGDGSFASLGSDEKVAGYFDRHFGDVVDLMPGLVADFERNPVGTPVTVRCWPWVIRGRGCTVALVGDAAHAIVPFIGQGANCAFEDCVEIERCLAEAEDDWERALSLYQQRRKVDTDAVAVMALDNFVEMRDKVSSPAFRVASRAEHVLERMLGGRYMTRYELVSFTTTPYSQIASRRWRQSAGVAAVALAVGMGAVFSTGAYRQRHGHVAPA